MCGMVEIVVVLIFFAETRQVRVRSGQCHGEGLCGTVEWIVLLILVAETRQHVQTDPTNGGEVERKVRRDHHQ